MKPGMSKTMELTDKDFITPILSVLREMVPSEFMVENLSMK
jgi:hypothetical protein